LKDSHTISHQDSEGGVIEVVGSSKEEEDQLRDDQINEFEVGLGVFHTYSNSSIDQTQQQQQNDNNNTFELVSFNGKRGRIDEEEEEDGDLVLGNSPTTYSSIHTKPNQNNNSNKKKRFSSFFSSSNKSSKISPSKSKKNEISLLSPAYSQEGFFDFFLTVLSFSVILSLCSLFSNCNSGGFN